MTTARLGGVALLTVLLTACGEAPLAERDPAGYEACSMLAEISAGEDVTFALGGLLMMGEQARKSGTKAIRDTATAALDREAVDASGGTNDFPLVDVDALRRVCEDEGFEF